MAKRRIGGIAGKIKDRTDSTNDMLDEINGTKKKPAAKSNKGKRK